MSNQQNETDNNIRTRDFIYRQKLNHKTFLAEDWEFPLDWEAWCSTHWKVDPKVIDILADKFTRDHINSQIRSRNWYATWKVWAAHALLRENPLTGKKQSSSDLQNPCPSSETEKLCPSCQKTFKD